MKSIKEIRKALQRIHHVAIGESDEPYMRIPADPNHDADLILSAAIDELEQLRGEAAGMERLLQGCFLPLTIREVRRTDGTAEAGRRWYEQSQRFIDAIMRARDSFQRERDAARSALAKVRTMLDGTDRIGGDGYGIPECPWCHAQDERDGNENWHHADCDLVQTRAEIDVLEAT